MIKYNDINNNIVQVAFIIALKVGNKYTKLGVGMLTGISFLFKITTTKKTKIETPVINLEINLSLEGTHW